MNVDLHFTTAADDIDLLINCIDQLRDGNSDASVQVPCADRHQKHWDEIGAAELCRDLAEKYRNGARLKIPAEFLTEF